MDYTEDAALSAGEEGGGVVNLVFDLFCGLGGWSEAFIAEGYRAIGFDIEEHDYGTGGYPGELVLRDIRSITGAELVKQYGVPNVIVASPPCQEFSYMAMPWSKAKEKMRKILADPSEQTRLTDLFNQCFRIQREVSAAAGHYVPMVVENVRGAQRWVGKARWNFGSFYLWGDVPALMPIPRPRLKGRNNFHVHEKTGLSSPAFNGAPHEANVLLHESGIKAGDRNPNGIGWTNSFADTLKGEGNKTVGMNWSDQSKRGQDFTRIAGQQAMEGTKGVPHRTAGHWTNPAEHEGVKQSGIGGLRSNGKGDAWFENGAAKSGSKSSARKAASAMIAKIPPPLASWIANTFK